MNRRRFLHRTGVVAAALAMTRPTDLFSQPSTEEDWRKFEITTRIEVLKPEGRTRVWLPMPLATAPYQRTLGDTYRAEGGIVEMVERFDVALDMLVAEWPAGVAPLLQATSRVATRPYAANLAAPTVAPVDVASLKPFLRPTRWIPIDGIVKKTADAIAKSTDTDLDRARAIYEWIVEHTFRDPAVRGCGTGDIRFMLESGNLGGKCADLNALFVGLARASGIPARDVYGLRVAPSRLGTASLGLASSTATKAQHCRAEVYLTGFGWVPVDPADVRKVALEEGPGHLAIDDDRVKATRARLFGSWEMNWIAYNYMHDVVLPGAKRGTLPFFMYPQAETGAGRLDSLDPDAFRYEITVKEA